MLKIIIRFCVKEPWLVVLLAIAISVAGWFSYQSIPIDAIPDVGENQVIVLTPWPGRSPKDIEDQVTYPLSVSLLAVPGAESVRGKSMFGYSFVQVTFKDEIDFYWARSRVSEQLGTAASQLPTGVTPQLGPDATGLGQVYYYTLQPIEGRERYPVRLRYNRDLREQIDQLSRLPVVTHSGATVPLGELATLETTWGPGAINSENARLVAHVSFMTSGAAGDLESVSAVEEQLRKAQLLSPSDPKHLALPPGYSLEAVGSFRNQIEANLRLMWIIPVVIFINLLLIYVEFRSLPISLAVFSGIPVAFAGGMVLVGWMDVELNTAVWVGFIALFGLAVDDGVVMATYIHQLMQRRRVTSVEDIRNTVYEAGLKRIRPCMMTTITTLAALVPVLLATGRGADVARAMAIPVFGGMLAEPFTSFIVPTLYCAYLEFKMRFGFKDSLWDGAEEMPEEEMMRAA